MMANLVALEWASFGVARPLSVRCTMSPYVYFLLQPNLNKSFRSISHYTACGSKIEGLMLQLILQKLLVFRPNTLSGIFFDIQLLKQKAIIVIVTVTYMKKFNFSK